MYSQRLKQQFRVIRITLIHTHHPSMMCTVRLHKVYSSNEDFAAVPLERKNSPCPLEQLPGLFHQSLFCKTIYYEQLERILNLNHQRKLFSILSLSNYHKHGSMETNKNETGIFIYCWQENNKLIQLQKDNNIKSFKKIPISSQRTEHFTKDTQIVNRYMKMGSMSLGIGKFKLQRISIME